ncbi:MAG: amino acid ABC transporter permease [Paracoccaceae bacterium]
MGERGLVKWARENLFSGPLNTIATLAALYVAYLGISAVLPWLLNGVWNANSLAECREIITASAGEGAPGACWALIRERWHQWLFGFYPQDQYWRPTLAFGLLFVAIGPVLFADQRRKLLGIWLISVIYLIATLYLTDAPTFAVGAVVILIVELVLLSFSRPTRLIWFTLLYPALCFWLLWGGAIWTPVMAMVGLGVLYRYLTLSAPLIGAAPAAGIGVVMAVVWWLFLDAPMVATLSGIADISLPAVRSTDFGGFLLAITIGVTAISFSLPLGILLALARQSDLLIVKSLAVGFIEFIRGVPLITLLFTASLLLQYFLPPNTEFDIILRVIILVTLFAAAYLAEVIRGGLAALPRGQYEAADALGLDYWRAQRLIILPQALKISIPSIVSTFIGLFKDTTLVSFVGLLDPLRGVTSVVRADINWKGIYWEPYIFVGAIFFVICFGMSRYSMYLEQKLKTDHR